MAIFQMVLEFQMRTEDTEYGQDYWDSLDGGAGYQDSVMWEDFAHIVKELFGYDKNNIDISPKIQLIDIGCAYGFLVKHLRRRGFDAWGADYSQYAIDNGWSEYSRWIDLTSDSVPFWGWGYFNAFTCFETLEHIDEAKVDVALSKIHLMVKNGSRGFMTICTDDQPGWESDPTHVCIKSYDWWIDKLTDNGFKVLADKEPWVRQFHSFKDHNGIFVVEKLENE